jgi:hypothetical protein
LLIAHRAVTVFTMRSIGRVLQGIGLTIPLLAIFAQLSSRITAGQMLQFLFVAVCVFSIGYVLQRYSGSGSG